MPKCHVLAAAEADAMPAGNDDGLPVQTCCDLTGKTEITLDKGISFDAAPIVVAARVPLPGPAVANLPTQAIVTVVAHAHGPPLYLTNASFLI